MCVLDRDIGFLMAGTLNIVYANPQSGRISFHTTI